MNQYLRYAILTGLFAVLFLPFVVAGGFFFPFITGKAFAFRIIVEVVFALWVILALRDPSVRPKGSALLYALLAFIVSLGISTLLAENPGKAFWSNFERMEGYISLLHFGAYFLVLSSMLQTQKMWRAFWNTSMGVSIAVALYGVFQLAGFLTIHQGGVRLDATFGNATYLAVYMLFHFFVALIALINWKPTRLFQIFYVTSLALSGLMIFYTATRGTILGLVGGLFLSGILFVIFAKGHGALRKAGALLVALIIVVSGVFFMVKDSDFVQNNEVLSRIASISLEAGNVRFMVWGMAWEGFKERPVFGWGQEGFNYVFNKHYNPGMYKQEPWFDRAHNEFLDWLIAGGALGFLLYISLFAVALWRLWKSHSAFSLPERVLITGLLAGYAFHNLFVFDNLMSYILFFSLLAFIASRHGTANGEQRTANSAQSVSGATFLTSSGAVIVIMLFVVYFANIPGITRATGIINALRPYDKGLVRNFTEIQKTISPSGLGRQEAHERLVEFARETVNADLGESAEAQAFKGAVTRYTLERFGEEVERTPNDARLPFFLGSFFETLGRNEDALVQFEKALEFSPDKQATLLKMGVITAREGNWDGARARFKQALDLAPAYDDARIFYAISLIRLGELSRADALLVERFGTPLVNDPFLLQTYLTIGEGDRVIAVARTRVQEDPADTNRYVELAATLLQVNRREDAVAALEAAVAADPSFKAQGEAYIQQIRSGEI